MSASYRREQGSASAETVLADLLSLSEHAGFLGSRDVARAAVELNWSAHRVRWFVRRAQRASIQTTRTVPSTNRSRSPRDGDR